jgi:hypothetical protein
MKARDDRQRRYPQGYRGHAKHGGGVPGKHAVQHVDPGKHRLGKEG